MTAGAPERSGDTLTTSPWGPQESGARGLKVGARAGGSNTRKALSAAANEAGTRGCYWARTGKGEKTEDGRKIWEA